MIYDPRRRALELRERILKSMTPEELADYLANGGTIEPPLPRKMEDSPRENPHESMGNKK